MSWIRDNEGRLVNLDAVEMLEILPLEEQKDGNTHLLQAQISAEDADAGIALYIGTETQCHECLSLIESKLHMIPKVR